MIMAPDNDEWTEAEMLADDAAGKPLRRTPAEGIVAMQQRIRILMSRIGCLRSADTFDPTEEIRSLEQQLAEAHRRLAEYRQLDDGRN